MKQQLAAFPYVCRSLTGWVPASVNRKAVASITAASVYLSATSLRLRATVKTSVSRDTGTMGFHPQLKQAPEAYTLGGDGVRHHVAALFNL